MRTLSLLLLALIVSVANGQPVGLPPGNPAEWFTDTAVLALVVSLVVQFVKPHLPFEGVFVKAFAVAVGAVLGLLGHVVGLGDFPTFVAALSFGAAAGVLAAGGKDVLASLASKVGSGSGNTDPGGGTIPR